VHAQDLEVAISTVSSVSVIVQAMADLMAGLLVYACTGRTLVFGTVHETFRVSQPLVLHAT